MAEYLVPQENGNKCGVRIAQAQMGVSGDDSWGARTHEEYLLKADEKMTFSFVFKGL